MRDAQARVALTAQSLWALAATGVVRPYRPDRVFRIARTLVHWGTGLAGGYTALAARMPEAIGLVDERGSLTFDAIHRRSNALAHGLDGLGVQESDPVAILARNHRGLVETAVAAAKLGADVVYLDPDLSAQRLLQVLEREQPVVVVYDEESSSLLDAVPHGVHRVLAWVDDPDAERPVDTPVTLEQLIAANDDVDVRRPSRESRSVLLSSGSGGEPRGASRGSFSLEAAAALMSRLPLRYGWSTHVAAPLFHSWGWAHLNLSMLVGSTLVLRRQFGPEDFLRTLVEHGCQAAVASPVMLQRVLGLPDQVLAGYDLSHVRVIAVSGAALRAKVSTRWMDRFGDHLYNVYGSTECAWATVASPAELRLAPGTAGREPIGTVVRLLDDADRDVPDGQVGRVIVGNALLFDGYTGSGHATEHPGRRSERDRADEPPADGRLSMGDVAWRREGLLSVVGREDDTVVVQGESIHPGAVEECLAGHREVADVAVLGVRASDHDGGKLPAPGLVAFVARTLGSTIAPDRLQAYVQAGLGTRSVPREVVIVPDIPHSSTGKVQRDRLVDSLHGAGPDTSQLRHVLAHETKDTV